MLPSPLSSRWIHHFDQNQMPLSMHVLKYRIQVRSGYFIERMWHKMWCEWPGYNPDDPTQFQLGLLVMYFHQIKQQQKHLTIRKYNYACNDLTMNLTINTLSWQNVKLSNVSILWYRWYGEWTWWLASPITAKSTAPASTGAGAEATAATSKWYCNHFVL